MAATNNLPPALQARLAKKGIIQGGVESSTSLVTRYKITK